MLGLDAYDSSSEDEVQTKQPQKLERPKAPDSLKGEETAPGPAAAEPSVNINTAPSGPVLGPVSMDSQSPTGRSPFSTSRALIQDLTLPPVPNLDIPPSPPGSPDPAANAKFEHFLSLKKQGIHFNTKLASSSSLKNPSLMQKMMQHSGIDEQAQHESSLPAELWDTSALPQWGFKEELLRTQQDMRNKIEAQNASEPRSSIQFVSGSEAKGKSSA